jgi:hypothetical protein
MAFIAASAASLSRADGRIKCSASLLGENPEGGVLLAREAVDQLFPER